MFNLLFDFFISDCNISFDNCSMLCLVLVRSGWVLQHCRDVGKSSRLFNKYAKFGCVPVLLACVAFVGVEVNGCDDLHTWCPANKQFCGTLILKNACPKTCGTCLPPECSRCDQDCIVHANKTTSCTCFNGFRLVSDGINCEDIDECAEGILICKKDEVCQNDRGSSQCINNICTPFQSEDYVLSDSYNGTCCKRTNESQCGLNKFNNPNGRVIGGVDASIDTWPWQTLFILGNEKCGGTLINDRWIVSAAHCFEKYDLTRISSYNITVLLGLNDTTNTRAVSMQIRKVVEVISHPDYIFPYSDISLVRMNQPIAISDFVAPACLPNGEKPPVGTECYVTGYGTTHPESTNLPTRLQQAAVPLVDLEVCRKAYENFTHTVDTAKMVCAGYKAGRVDACRGDSGGPLVCQRCTECNWFLAGVTSFGRGCAQPDSYGIYTNVEHFEEWIASKINTVTVSKQTCESTMWSNWEQWSQCTDGCTGTQMRTRQCKNGIPGIPGCLGRTRQNRKCNARNQKVWSTWSECSVTCGAGEQTRERGCNQKEIERRACNKPTCVSWSQWGQWTTCQKRCEDEDRTRTRSCQGGNIGDNGCKGRSSETEKCVQDPLCTQWSSWSSWSQCLCPSGTQTSTRSCQGTSTSCVGESSRTRQCNPNTCGRWSQWSPWTQCTKTCGGGTRSRIRSCQGGTSCSGDNLQEEACYTEKCPVWSTWSEWSTCSRTCTGGSRTRSRTCGRGSLDLGKCSGSASDNEACGQGACQETHNCGPHCLNLVYSGHCFLNSVWMNSFCESDCCTQKVCRDTSDSCLGNHFGRCQEANFVSSCFKYCGWCG